MGHFLMLPHQPCLLPKPKLLALSVANSTDWNKRSIWHLEVVTKNKVVVVGLLIYL